MMRSAAARPMARPVRVPPVNAIMLIPGLLTSAAPTSAPPVTTLTIPLGMPASSARRPYCSPISGVNSEDLSTTALPAASAGAILPASWRIGELNAVIAATTPIGS